MTPESALVVPAPEAEPLAMPFRRRYDPGFGVGMPAHITLLYPFRSPDMIDSAVLRDLHDLFQQFAAFDFALTAVRRFPDEALYLAVEPEAPFRRLTLAAWDFSPDTPPYAGRYPEIIPHLTVARLRDNARLAAIGEKFSAAASGVLPIAARAERIALMETTGQRWQLRTTFPLGRQ